MRKPLVVKKKSITINYEGLEPFIQKKITPLQFADYCSTQINLFTVDSDFNFENTEASIDKMLSTLGSMKRIFSKPLIDLIDVNNVMPVESVKKIYSKTIEYSINHTSTIANIYEDGSIKPRELLSIEYKLLYETYENLVFCYLVNMMMKFAKRNLMTLNNYLFVNQNEINMNILERLNHLNYYLAVGKLHTSYMRNFSNSFDDVQRLIFKLRTIYDTLAARLNSKVYVKCKSYKKSNRNQRLQLKKTNIFRNQKDYRRVYNLTRFMLLNYDALLDDSISEEEYLKLKDLYFNYSLVLTVFSITHFNFSLPPNSVLDFKKLKANFKFKKFKLSVQKKSIKKVDYILIEVSKDVTYRFVIYCASNPKLIRHEFALIKANVRANEYLTFSPYPNALESIYISSNNIDSFRRIQQFILRGMVYADKKRDICPFCGEPLVKVESFTDKDTYECLKCRTVISKKTCPNTKRSYYTTYIKNYSDFIYNLKDKNKLEWLYAHNLESQMYFRNINDLDGTMHDICPHCGEVHNINK